MRRTMDEVMAGRGPATRTGSAAWIEPALAMLLAVVAVLLVLDLPLHTLARFERNSSEGWNAFHALALAQGRPLYAPPDALFTNNYPPLSFVVIGPLGSLMGDHVMAGRLVSLLSFAFVAWAVYAIARELGASRAAALVAPAFLLAFNAIHGVNHLAVNDPQWLGHALASAALLAFLRNRASFARKLLVVLLAVAALSVKVMYVPVPLAIVAWLLLFERRALPAWILAGVIVGAATGALWLGLFGSDMILSMASAEQSRVLSYRKALAAVVGMLPLIVPAGALMVLALATRLPDRPSWLLAFYGALGAAFGVLFHMGDGVRANAFFDLAIALSAGAALGLGRLAELVANGRGWAGAARPLTAGVLALVALGAAAGGLPKVARSLATAREDHLAYQRAIDGVAAVDGPAFCQVLVVCYWAGKNGPIDAWSTAIKLREGTVPLERVASLVRDRHFAVVQVRVPGAVAPVQGAADGIGVHQFPPSINELWAGRYEIIYRDAANVLLRRRDA
jgi:hypothetical protein